MGLLNWLNPLQPFIDAAERAYKARLDASNDADRIAAEREEAYWKERVSAAQTAAQSDKPWSPRTIMGYCVAIYVFKIIVWDTVLGMGITFYPGEHVSLIVMTIIGFYFVSRGAETVANTIATAFRARR